VVNRGLRRGLDGELVHLQRVVVLLAVLEDQPGLAQHFVVAGGDVAGLQQVRERLIELALRVAGAP